jgi:3-hydroxybutyryl-CoA dehydrogenase
MAEIVTVGVAGAGTMGSGIAHVFARAGFGVLLCDVEQRFLDRALSQIRANLGREAAKGKLSEAEIEPVLARITPTLDREALASAGFVIEAAPERFELKAEIFRSLDCILPQNVILATNTSSISITKLAAVTRRPAQVAGMHFFNPVPMMTLVEVVRGLATDDSTLATLQALMPLINEAAFAVMEGVATPQAVDQVFKLGMAHPMGPLTLADFIGLDVCVDILRVLQEGFGDPKYRPCPLLVRMVDAGWLGRKSGRGFYTYVG